MSPASVDAGGRPPAPAHGPALGVTHRLLGRFHVTGIFWYRLHYWTATKAPAWLRRFAIAVFTPAFWICMPRIRRAVSSNLDPVLGRAGWWQHWRRSYRTMHEFAECLTDRYQRMASPERVRFTVDGESSWREATDSGRGAVLVTAHIGTWETSAYVGAEHERRVVHLVREEEIDPRAQQFIRDLVERGGEPIVTHFANNDPRLAIELSEALGRGELVALQGDRPRAGSRTTPAMIFGRPIPLPIGPAALARAAGVPIVPIFSFREGECSSLTSIRPPILVARTADRQADLAAAVAAIAREIEWAIRQRPYQWFCFRRLWEEADRPVPSHAG